MYTCICINMWKSNAIARVSAAGVIHLSLVTTREEDIRVASGTYSREEARLTV